MEPQPPESGANFSGKLLVQLSSGTPQEARVSEAWAQQHQVDCLEGKIRGTRFVERIGIAH